MIREEYLNTHSKEETLDQALAYWEIAQDLQERVKEFETLMPDEIKREGIHVGELQSKVTLRELMGCYLNDPQKAIEYPLDKKDIFEGFHKAIYSAIVYLAKLGFKEIKGPEIYEYLKERHRFSERNKDFVDEYVYRGKIWNTNTDPKFVANLVEDMKKWTLLRESFKQGKDISWFYDKSWDSESMERFRDTSLEEMHEYFDRIPVIEKDSILLPELY